MRGDGVGVGDVDEVHVGASVGGDTSGGDDGRGAGQQRDAKLVIGCGWRQPGSAWQPGMLRIGVIDGAWGKRWTRSVLWLSEAWTDGMRSH